MKVYLATSFQNIPEARALMGVLESAGHVITHNWTHEQLDPSWPIDRQAAYLQSCGARDFDGVFRADVLVLVNHALNRDAMTEFGIAIGLNKPVIVLYPDRRTSVFFHRALQADTVVEMLELLRGSIPYSVEVRL